VVNKHQPFDDHTLQLLNAAVWFCESRRPNGRYEWRIVGEGGKLMRWSDQGKCEPQPPLTSSPSVAADRQ
jgi:hypothetical protein